MATPPTGLEPPRDQRLRRVVRIVLVLIAVIATACAWGGVSLRQILSAVGF